MFLCGRQKKRKQIREKRKKRNSCTLFMTDGQIFSLTNKMAL